MKFEKEWIKCLKTGNTTLWVCHDYLGDNFISISQCETEEASEDTLKTLQQYGGFCEGEHGELDVLDNTPVIVITTDPVKEEVVKELKKYFIEELKKSA